MRRIRDFGLTLVLLGLFGLCIFGQFVTGYRAYNNENMHQGRMPVASWTEYAVSGHFVGSVAENMESEFLQMALFVWLTVALYQRGSSESKRSPDDRTAKDKEIERKEKAYGKPRRKKHPILWRIYENSLTIALLLLFSISFGFHAIGRARTMEAESPIHTKIPLTEVLRDSEFWFESFQNWESEFFSIAVLGLLSIFLRQRGSPQSKRMFDPTWKTGE